MLSVICLSCNTEQKNEKIDIFIENRTSSENKDTSYETQPDKYLKSKISVELAITPAQQAYGFMERKTIPRGTGMLFLYKTDSKLKFWMKNTPHPLSIAFIDSAGVIREIYDMIPYSLQTTASIHSVRYALEVPQGMFSEMGIVEGSRLSHESLLLLKRKAAESYN